MKPTLEQQGNLLKLASGLAALPENYTHFSMGVFCLGDNDCWNQEPIESTKKKINSCGTVACALGHAPSILKIKGLPGEWWYSYSSRTLGLIVCMVEWDYLFSDQWDAYDNTSFGAACRIVKFLENDCKVPKNGIPWIN